MLRSINGHLKALHKIKATSSTLLQVIFTTMNCWLDFLLRSCSLIKGGILVTGCSRTHSAVTLGDWSDPLDPDVETQMIFKQLLQGRDKLRSVSSACMQLIFRSLEVYVATQDCTAQPLLTVLRLAGRCLSVQEYQNFTEVKIR